jgi:hypothetical protein
MRGGDELSNDGQTDTAAGRLIAVRTPPESFEHRAARSEVQLSEVARVLPRARR